MAVEIGKKAQELKKRTLEQMLKLATSGFGLVAALAWNVDMVFFATPEKSVGHVAEGIKSKLLSFIWIPWEETTDYIAKSDAVLIGPGFMRFKSETVPHGQRNHFCDEVCMITRKITLQLIEQFPKKKWVIDAGSLQVMEPKWLPKGCIVTPNKKEYQYLFGDTDPSESAKKYNCTIVLKGPTTFVCSPKENIEIKGGNAGMTKGGTGDIVAGLTAALFAKNDAFLAGASASYIAKKAAEELAEDVDNQYNADDLAFQIPKTFRKLTES